MKYITTGFVHSWTKKCLNSLFTSSSTRVPSICLWIYEGCSDRKLHLRNLKDVPGTAAVQQQRFIVKLAFPFLFFTFFVVSWLFELSSISAYSVYSVSLKIMKIYPEMNSYFVMNLVLHFLKGYSTHVLGVSTF